MEEVGLEVENIDYITSMVYVRPDNILCIIVSLFGNAVGKDVKLCPALTDYKWVNLEEAKDFDLIEGIYDELIILDKKLKGQKVLWKQSEQISD